MDNFAVRFTQSVVTGSLALCGKRNVNQCLQPDDKTLLEPKHEKEKQIRSREETIFHSVATDWDPAAPLFWTSLSLLAQNNYFSFRIHLQLCTFDTWSFFQCISFFPFSILFLAEQLQCRKIWFTSTSTCINFSLAAQMNSSTDIHSFITFIFSIASRIGLVGPKTVKSLRKDWRN